MLYTTRSPLKFLSASNLTISTSVTTATLPAGAKLARIYAEDQPIRVNQGADPVATTTGRLVPSTAEYEVLLDGSDLRMTREGASDAAVSVVYYGT